MKLKFVFSYDGSAFLGSAKQPHKKSVQDNFENALSHILIFLSVFIASFICFKKMILSRY